jgi:hypothetical protein
MKIQLIQKLSELDGGEFLEIFPGPFKGRSWNEQSVYIEDKAFALIEPIIKKHAPQFDNRTNTAIPSEAWTAIISDLLALKETLKKAKSIEDLQGVLSFRDGTGSEEFGSEFQINVGNLDILIDALIVWLRKELDTQPIISVLGI